MNIRYTNTDVAANMFTLNKSEITETNRSEIINDFNSGNKGASITKGSDFLNVPSGDLSQETSKFGTPSKFKRKKQASVKIERQMTDSEINLAQSILAPLSTAETNRALSSINQRREQELLALVAFGMEDKNYNFKYEQKKKRA